MNKLDEARRERAERTAEMMRGLFRPGDNVMEAAVDSLVLMQNEFDLAPATPKREVDKMKRKAEIVEVDEGGLISMLNEPIFLMCGCYFYTGKLVGVNGDHVELEGASLVYETGKWSDDGYLNAQPLPGKVWRVMLQSIESWGDSK